MTLLWVPLSSEQGRGTDTGCLAENLRRRALKRQYCHWWEGSYCGWKRRLVGSLCHHHPWCWSCRTSQRLPWSGLSLLTFTNVGCVATMNIEAVQTTSRKWDRGGGTTVAIKKQQMSCQLLRWQSSKATSCLAAGEDAAEQFKSSQGRNRQWQEQRWLRTEEEG